MALNLPELEREVERAARANKATFTLDTVDMQELVHLALIAGTSQVTQKQVLDYAYGAD